MNRYAHRLSRIKQAVFVTVIAVLLVSASGCSLFQKTVFYVNSYHKGHGPSDGVMAGMRETLRSSNVHLRVFMLDAARYPDEGLIEERVEKALFEVGEYEPDVIMASDDNAVRYFLVPNFASGPIPCVFCGVDWTCDQYGLPAKYVTGMLEVAPVEETISILKPYYPQCKTVFVLSENTSSERRSVKVLNPVFEKAGLSPSYSLVETYEQWKSQFI